MTTWTLTATGPSAAALNLAAEQAGIPGVLPFGEDGTQDPGIWYDEGICDFIVSVTGDQPGNRGFAPVWMYRVREYLEQSGYRATVTAADLDPAFRGTGTDAGSALRRAEMQALVVTETADDLRAEDDEFGDCSI